MTEAAGLLADLTRLGIEVVARADRLRYRPRSAVTPGLLARLEIHKAALLAILRPTGGPDGFDSVAAEKETDPPAPCPGCGGIMFWWNPIGDRRCAACDPPKAAARLLETTERIRRRHRLPRPAGAAEVLRDLNSQIG